MKNRELAIKLLERLEYINTNLNRIVKTGEPLKTYIDELDKSKEIIIQLKSMVELEPVSAEYKL